MVDVTAKTRRLEALKGRRQPHEQVWADCYAYTHPVRAHGLNQQTISAQDAQQRKARMTDGTAIDAARTLTSGIVSGLHPSNSLWFQMDVGQESEEERRWLDEAAKFIFENIHAANFDACSFECLTDLVDIGWFVLYTEEAPEGGYRFEQWPIAQCFISSSKAGGLIDTVYRTWEYTVEQCVNEYGLDKVSESVRQKYNNKNFDDKVKLLHVIEPRSLYLVGGKLAKNLPFASCHIEVQGNHLVRESGYNEFPCAVPRWMLIPDSPYATGPISDVLPDIRTLNEIKRMELAALDLAIAGMWIAEDDGVLNPRTVTVGPRKVIVANSVDSMKELKSGADFQVSFTAEERLQAAIRKALLADQLQPQDGPTKTATEIIQRMNLIRQLLGPIYGRLMSEYLQALIERCFGIALRAGVLGAPPESLAERTYHIKYISPLARAQKLEEVAAIDQYVAGAAQAAALDPSVMDNVDMDEAMRLRGAALGVPSKIIPSRDDVTKKRKDRVEAQKAQQQQQVQMQQQAAVGEAAAKKVATA